MGPLKLKVEEDIKWRTLKGGSTVSSSHDTHARDNIVLLTTSVWSIIGPLDKHEDHHVQEQEAQKYDLREELTINADASLKVSETKTTELSGVGHTSSLALSWLTNSSKDSLVDLLTTPSVARLYSVQW
jgi:hypothetical protein